MLWWRINHLLADENSGSPNQKAMNSVRLNGNTIVHMLVLILVFISIHEKKLITEMSFGFSFIFEVLK